MKATRHNMKGTAAPQKIGGGTKNRLISLFVALSFFVALIPVFSLPASAAATTSLTGKGKIDDPYLIKNANDLNTFATEINNGTIPGYGSGLYFKLTNNIPSLGNWTPIAQFNGIFDGRNHTISGINVSQTTQNYAFFWQTTNATIKNLHLEGNATVTHSTPYMSGLVGIANTSTISNCSFDGTLTAQGGTRSLTGGLVRTATGTTITGCWTSGQINSIKKDTSTEWSHESPLVQQLNATAQVKLERCYTDMNGSACSARTSTGLGGHTSDGSKPPVFYDCYSTGTGYTRAFVGYINPGRKISMVRCHVYNTENKAVKWTASGTSVGTFSTTNTYQLHSTSPNTSSYTVNRVDADAFKNAKTGFTGWDFSDTDGDPAVWKMNKAGTYPILKSYVEASLLDKKHTYYGSSDNELFLPDYFDLILSENQNYKQEGRFKFSVTSPQQVTPRVWDSDSWSYTPGTPADIAKTDGDNLVLNPDAPVGTYTVTVHAVDTDTDAPFDPFDMTFTITKKEKVPVPEVLTGYANLPYSPMQTLNDIKITDGWAWDNLNQVPKNNDAGLYISSYDAFYELDSSVSGNYGAFYDWSDVNADPRYTVVEDLANDRILVKVDPLVVKTADSPVIVHIFVEDEDTGVRINGAAVTCGCGIYPDEFPKGASSTSQDVTATDATHGDGYVYAELAPGYHPLTVKASGYDEKTETVTVYKSGDEITIKLKREPGQFVVPKVYLKDAAGDPTTIEVQGAKVIITKIKGKAAAWENTNGGSSVSGSPGDPLTLPIGDASNEIIYKLKSATYRYSTDDVIYMKFVDGTPTYFEDEACQTAGRNYLLASAMDEPVYLTKVSEVAKSDPSDPQRYKVTIDIKYIKATYGTFALKYDPDVFTFNPSNTANVVLGSGITSLTTVEQTYKTLNMSFDNENGYYAFVWHTSENDDVELDAEINQQNIVTLYFTLKDGYTADDASIDWFGIIPWGDTEAAKAAVKDTANYKGEADQINLIYWREVDNDNNPPTPAFGRIERSKAVVNDEDMGGFFQASVNADPTDTAQSAYFFDVKTQLTYDFDIVNSIIRFHVYDADGVTGNLKDATVDLFDLNMNLEDSKNTNIAGIAKFNINTASNANGYDFKYNVYKLGYWPVPEGNDPAPQLSAPTGVVTNREVPLEKKIYHKPVMLNPTAPAATALVGNADLGGEKYAYNNRPFHFRCKAAKGYKITKYPTSANVYIYDYTGSLIVDLSVSNNNTELTPDGLGMFTLDKQYLTNNLPTLKSLTDEQFNALLAFEQTSHDPTIHQYDSPYYDRNNDPTAYPDGDGFRGYNIYIEFNDFDFKELAYKVEGVTNAGGEVTYTADTANNELPEDTYSQGDTHYCRVTTITDDKDTPAVNETNRLTGTFTFTATGNNKIEKVYINGLRTYIYDGETSLTYSFGEVDMDCNITVLFYDGTEAGKNKDSLVTLVVGEYGEVETFSPEAEQELSITRRVYLNPASDLVFKPTPDNGYNLFMVRKETEVGGVSSYADITANYDQGTGNYKVEAVKGKNIVVYVTFNNPLVNETPNIFVKSYAYQGKGVMKPAGILIYTKYDTVDIGLSTDAPYSVKGVVLQPFDDLTQITSTYNFPTQSTPLLSATYTYPSLKENIAIGGVFAEKSYPVTGIVDLNQGINLTQGPCLTGATVTFVRLDGNDDELPQQVPYKFTTTNARTNAAFTGEVPAGKWNVYVEKPGYLTYKLTKFEMKSDGSTANFGAGHHIVPYIGASANGKMINLVDAANVKSGWRKGVNSIIKSRADVDDDGDVGIYDITYVWDNYNMRLIVQEYDDFAKHGSL